MSKKPSIFKRIVRPLVNNEVRTGSSKWYPELEPRTFDASTEDVREAIVRVVDKRPRWKMDALDEPSHTIDFTAKTKRMGFVDDITVELDTRGDATTVSVHSRSREGRGDFGKNASRIEEFYDRLSTELRAS